MNTVAIKLIPKELSASIRGKLSIEPNPATNSFLILKMYFLLLVNATISSRKASKFKNLALEIIP